jgi:hypothetical protein
MVIDLFIVEQGQKIDENYPFNGQPYFDPCLSEVFMFVLLLNIQAYHSHKVVNALSFWDCSARRNQSSHPRYSC